MKLVWKGRYKGPEQLPIGSLPSNAVKFKEPKNFAMMNLVASLFIIPVMLLAGIAMFVKLATGGSPESLFNVWGLVLAYLMIVPHEILHAIAFPKDSEVEVWYSLKNLVVFVFSTSPMSKMRFILMSLLPSIVFGLIPLIIWTFIPNVYSQVGAILFSFSISSLLLGVGDYVNVFNAAWQMPQNSITQLSGFHSYWYLPEKESCYRK